MRRRRADDGHTLPGREGASGVATRFAAILGHLLGLSLLFAGSPAAVAETLEWREEVALQDGGSLVASRRMQLVPGAPFQTMPGAQRLSFINPTTQKPVVWENPGKIGSRVSIKMLNLDSGRPYLVSLAQSDPDYDALGCPTPPYIVFRYDTGSWTRVPLEELPRRFVRMNLVMRPDRDFLKAHGYFVPAAVSARLKKEIPGSDYHALMFTVDRRIRNPIGLGCSRDAIERIYGVEKYAEWRGTGNWLDKTEDEALSMLRRKGEGTNSFLCVGLACSIRSWLDTFELSGRNFHTLFLLTSLLTRQRVSVSTVCQ